MRVIVVVKVYRVICLFSLVRRLNSTKNPVPFVFFDNNKIEKSTTIFPESLRATWPSFCLIFRYYLQFRDGHFTPLVFINPFQLFLGKINNFDLNSKLFWNDSPVHLSLLYSRLRMKTSEALNLSVCLILWMISIWWPSSILFLIPSFLGMMLAPSLDLFWTF